MAQSKIDVNDLLADDLAAALGQRPEREYVFTPYRKWRVDIAFPQQKLAVEVDGNQHRRAIQRRKDAEKQNALVEENWRVMRFPASSVLTKKRRLRIVEQICRVLSRVCSPEEYSCVLEGE